MDRGIVYPGSIPLDSDLLSVNRNTMVALGALMRAVFGTNVVVDGLACAATSPPTMSVTVGPGAITSFTTVDATAYGTLPADTADSLVKMGVNLTSSTFTLTAPGSSGQAINYLIEASFSEGDNTPLVLPYYNAANPSIPYSGPNNSGTAQSTQRVQRVALALVPGAPALQNFQTTPTPDPGWVGLYVITIFYGQTTVAGGTINTYSAAPFITRKLPQLTPGQSNMQVLSASQSWSPPLGITLVRVRMVGGGGGGGAGSGGAGGGGAGAGSVEGYFAVTPGTAVACTVGPAGAAGAAGGASSFGTAAVAGGGGAGAAGSSGSGGAGSSTAGAGAGTGVLLSGRPGQNGFANSTILLSGAGGASSFGDGANGTMAAAGINTAGGAGVLPGSGGAGGIGTGAGGSGAPGLIVVEW